MSKYLQVVNELRGHLQYQTFQFVKSIVHNNIEDKAKYMYFIKILFIN